jgi:hypothetical protein
MILVHNEGTMDVTITVITHYVGGVPQTYSTAAPMTAAETYTVVMFSNAVKYNTLTNPTAV